MKIYVCGNCWLDTLKDAIAAAFSIQGINATVEGRRFKGSLFHPAHLNGELERLVKQFDLVVTNSHQFGSYLDTYKVPYFMLPDLFFHGFQPDVCYVRKKSAGGSIFFKNSTAMSLIAFYGWKRDFPVNKTVRFFNEQVFEAIGYFRAFAFSTLALEERFKSAGCPSERVVYELCRPIRGMHEIWHPTLRVSYALVDELFNKMNLTLKVRYADLVDCGLPDRLASEVVWPVYPEIADRLGFVGGYLTNKAGFILRNLDELVSWQYSEFDNAAKSDGCDKGSLVLNSEDLPPYRTLEEIAETLS